MGQWNYSWQHIWLAESGWIHQASTLLVFKIEIKHLKLEMEVDSMTDFANHFRIQLALLDIDKHSKHLMDFNGSNSLLFYLT